MSKPPRPPGNRTRPSRSGFTPANPWSHVIAATEATLIKEGLERGDTGAQQTDAELLAECAIVQRVTVRPVTLTEQELERAILRASVRRPQTLAGWRAKVDMALLMIQAGREEVDAASDDVDRMVPWLVLNDVLALIDSLESVIGKSVR